jgi:hypothetical protein
LSSSLIIGIKKWKYKVDITEDMVTLFPYFVCLFVVTTLQVIFKPDSFRVETVADYHHCGPPSTFIANSVTGPAVYHFGVIDFLQNWTFEKTLERAFKIYFLRKDPDGLSVMPPLFYKARFQNKLDQIFDLEGECGGIGKMEFPPEASTLIHEADQEITDKASPDKDTEMYSSKDIFLSTEPQI